MIQRMMQLLQMMEQNTAIDAVKELCCEDIHPSSKLYNVFNGNIVNAIKGIDNVTILKAIAANLRNLRKQIDSAIMDNVGTCEAKIRTLDCQFQYRSYLYAISRFEHQKHLVSIVANAGS